MNHQTRKRRPAKADLPAVENKNMIYPQYFKKDSTYTLLHSEREYTQVQLLKTCTIITRGGNLHVIEDLKQATAIDAERFHMAQKEGQSRLFN